MHYISKKGNKVELKVSNHAFSQFCKRYAQVFPTDKVEDWPTKLHLIFKCARQSTRINSHKRARLEKYGKDTIYFESEYFRFVIQDCEVVTIEIRHEEYRYLN